MEGLVRALPAWAVFALVTGAFCAAAVALPRLRRRVAAWEPEERAAIVALDGLKAAATLVVFVLAISLNQVLQHHRHAEELVAREASAVNQFDRGLARAGVPALAELRPFLADYVRSVVEEEWPLLASGGRSDRAAALLLGVQRQARLAEAETPRQQAALADAFRAMEQVSDARDARLAASGLALPWLFWLVVAAGLVLLLPLCAASAAALHADLVRLAVVGSVALFLCLVALMNRPFGGEMGVSPAPLERALARMEARVP